VGALAHHQNPSRNSYRTTASVQAKTYQREDMQNNVSITVN